jgi:Transposase domain (DUF772)
MSPLRRRCSPADAHGRQPGRRGPRAEHGRSDPGRPPDPQDPQGGRRGPGRPRCGVRGLHSRIGRPSVPPEQLLKATILTALYSIRSERAFCERLNYDLLFKWFLDMPIDAPAFDPTTFTKNRERLLEADIADRFSRRGSPPGQAAPLHLLRALLRGRDAAGGLASHNSFKPKQGPPPPAISGGRNSESRVPRPAPHEPNAPLNDRSGGAARPKVQRRGLRGFLHCSLRSRVSAGHSVAEAKGTL